MSYGRGEKNISAKLTESDVRLIRGLHAERNRLISDLKTKKRETKDQIEKLSAEIKRLRTELRLFKLSIDRDLKQLTNKSIAEKMEISERTVRHAKNGEYWSHVE